MIEKYPKMQLKDKICLMTMDMEMQKWKYGNSAGENTACSETWLNFPDAQPPRMHMHMIESPQERRAVHCEKL